MSKNTKLHLIWNGTTKSKDTKEISHLYFFGDDYKYVKTTTLRENSSFTLDCTTIMIQI